jgi:hypothetical protein
VRWEFPFPKETPVIDKTHVVKVRSLFLFYFSEVPSSQKLVLNIIKVSSKLCASPKLLMLNLMFYSKAMDSRVGIHRQQKIFCEI